MGGFSLFFPFSPPFPVQAVTPALLCAPCWCLGEVFLAPKRGQSQLNDTNMHGDKTFSLVLACITGWI